MQYWRGFHWLKPAQPADEQAGVRGSCCGHRNTSFGVCPSSSFSKTRCNSWPSPKPFFQPPEQHPPSCTAHHQDCFGSAGAVQELHLGSSPGRALGNVYHVWILPVPRPELIIHAHTTSFHMLRQLPPKAPSALHNLSSSVVSQKLLPRAVRMEHLEHQGSVKVRCFSQPSSCTNSALASPSSKKISQLAKGMAPRLGDGPCAGDSSIHPQHCFCQGSAQWSLSQLHSCTGTTAMAALPPPVPPGMAEGRGGPCLLRTSGSKSYEQPLGTGVRVGEKRDRAQKELPEPRQNFCQSKASPSARASPWATQHIP